MTLDEIFVGRGPDLIRAHFNGPRNELLVAADFDSEMHLEFHGTQVFMFVPDEVEGFSDAPTDWNYEASCLETVCLGKSNWLKSFAPTHLKSCDHYRLRFYDDILHVICERITIHNGYFVSPGTVVTRWGPIADMQRFWKP